MFIWLSLNREKIWLIGFFSSLISGYWQSSNLRSKTQIVSFLQFGKQLLGSDRKLIPYVYSKK
ncbi:MAG: hypothetical protein CMK43_06305 [Porticoccaceae bacterium]|nr:hypothetical protein [Porticoccaceae bacterium]